jgi:hypothetical protein
LSLFLFWVKPLSIQIMLIGMLRIRVYVHLLRRAERRMQEGERKGAPRG